MLWFCGFNVAVAVALDEIRHPQVQRERKVPFLGRKAVDDPSRRK